jgi:hypothetical protein
VFSPEMPSLLPTAILGALKRAVHCALQVVLGIQTSSDLSITIDGVVQAAGFIPSDDEIGPFGGIKRLPQDPGVLVNAMHTIIYSALHAVATTSFNP